MQTTDTLPHLGVTLGTLRVVNKRRHTSTPNDLYIGRPSVLGNPFHIGKDGDRDEVIRKYRIWLNHHRTVHSGLGAEVQAALRTIRATIERGRDVNLVCYCAPCACHGDVIKELLEKGGL